MKLEKKLIDAFISRHPKDASKVFLNADGPSLGSFMANANPQSIALSLMKVPPQTAAIALSNMSADQAVRIMQELPLDMQLTFMHAFDINFRDQLLEAMPAHQSQKLHRLIEYPKGSAGRLMDPLPTALNSDCLVADALKQIQNNANTIRYYIYITDDQGCLVGVVSLRQLLNASNQALVSSIMETRVACLTDLSSEGDIIEHPSWKNFHALPVVDRNKRLVGIIRYETLGQLKAARSEKDSAHSSLSVLLAISELCWLGMTGYLDTLTTFRSIDSTSPDTDGNSYGK